MDRLWLRIAVAAAFVGFGLLLIYGFWKEPYDEGLQDLPFAVVVALSVLVYAATGFIIGRWWVVPLLAVPVLFALPAGAITADDDQLPVHTGYLAVTIMFLGPVAIVGLIARIIRDRRRLRSRVGGQIPRATS